MQRGEVEHRRLAGTHRRADGDEAQRFECVDVLLALDHPHRVGLTDSLDAVQVPALRVAGLPEPLVGGPVYDPAVAVLVLDALLLVKQVLHGQVQLGEDVRGRVGVRVDEGLTLDRADRHRPVLRRVPGGLRLGRLVAAHLHDEAPVVERADDSVE